MASLATWGITSNQKDSTGIELLGGLGYSQVHIAHFVALAVSCYRSVPREMKGKAKSTLHIPPGVVRTMGIYYKVPIVETPFGHGFRNRPLAA